MTKQKKIQWSFRYLDLKEKPKRKKRKKKTKNEPEQIKDSSQILPGGILVFTNHQILAHKQEDGFVYWGTMKLPKKFVERMNIENAERVAYEDRFPYELITEFPLYIAVEGRIRGYFIIHKISEGDYDDFQDKISNFHLEFNSDSWYEIENGEVLKPSQGWRYYPK